MTYYPAPGKGLTLAQIRAALLDVLNSDPGADATLDFSLTRDGAGQGASIVNISSNRLGDPDAIGGAALDFNAYHPDGANATAEVGLFADTDSTSAGVQAVADVAGARVLLRPVAEFEKIAAPPAAPGAHLYLYGRDNGAGKTQLVIKWDDGTVTVLGTSP